MKRTQIYLDEDLLKAVQTIAKQRRATVSDIVRGALREKYLSHRPDRAEVLLSVVGAWAGRKDLEDSTAFVRSMRKGNRGARLAKLVE